ncbi:MAG: DUF2298 domain-containing protein [Anaerolineaceae bacterium]|nr:DUF2298 domain-containing protein [Anaerolineaceae bacterium]
MDDHLTSSKHAMKKDFEQIIILLLLIGIVIVGYLFRSYNLQWDMGTHLHPDERFLSQVENDTQPVKSLSEYFDTAQSTLNPHNRGHGFFVYGTLPVFIIRYLGELTQQTGYDPITMLGRELSVFTELVSIILIFLIGRKLVNDWLGLGAAAFYALSVLPIQQAHFMTVDTFTNTFGLLTVYAGVLILMQKRDGQGLGPSRSEPWLYVFFGLALGMAAASKANAITLALLLPLIVYVRYQTALIHGQQAQPFLKSLGLMVLAGLVSFLTFRIFQPYAFAGPSFFNFSLNPKWLANMKEISAASKGLSDSPPALQWARRSALFAPYNLAVWGMGIPFALMAIAGFVGQVYSGIRNKDYRFLPILSWMLFYFLWQSLSWTPSMRYLLLIYPLLALSAAWACMKLWCIRKPAFIGRLQLKPKHWVKVGRLLVLAAIAATAVWAFAFTRIYSRDFSRVTTSNWIYENLPGALTLNIQTDSGPQKLPLGFPAKPKITGSAPFYLIYSANETENLGQLKIPSVLDENNKNNNSLYSLEVFDLSDGRRPLGSPQKSQIGADTKENPNGLNFNLGTYSLQKGHNYLFEVRALSGQSSTYYWGEAVLSFIRSDGSLHKLSLPQITSFVSKETPQSYTVYVPVKGMVNQLQIPYILDFAQANGTKTLAFSLSLRNAPENVSTGQIQSDFLSLGTGKGTAFQVSLDKPLQISSPQELLVQVSLKEGEGALGITAPVSLFETSWDDALPVGLPGYVAYGDPNYNRYGAYQVKNLEMYWNENQEKRDRIIDLLNNADQIMMSSNRVWGTTVRVPERYPLATLFYKELMGCPAGADIVRCYNDAKLGSYKGRLGFDLVDVGTSYPTLGNVHLNDQYAEEAFSVYDHPKTLIFRKNAQFNLDEVKALFAEVDLSKVVNITAKQADTYKANDTLQSQLQLTPAQIKTQTEGGTWSELFDRQSPLNQSPFLGAAALYAFITLFGWMVFPFVRLALGGLKDKGFAFTKISGLLMLAYIVFIGGNYGIQSTRATILAVFLLIVLLNLIIAFLTRKGLADDLKTLWKQFLVMEIVALLAFAFFLWVRYQNPDLWHPWKGGEKPMDFSFWNAVIKSSIFPAYNPWFAGDFINYYYYGFVILAMPVKLLGVIPAIAYNIILPIWYSLVFMGAFSLGWNLLKAVLKQNVSGRVFGQPFFAGLWSALLLAFLGNLGAVRLFKETLEKMGSGGADVNMAAGFQKLAYFFAGLFKYFQKVPMPLYPGDWYWIPSRMIPGEPITEFPMFTFLYADLHAHLMVMPVAILAVAWVLSYLGYRMKFGTYLKSKLGHLAAVFALGGLALGSLKPTNTWDFYTYPLLALCVVLYTGLKYAPQAETWRAKLKAWWPAFASAAGLFALSVLMYKPFNTLFHPGYNKIALWEGARTPLRSYTGHWGVFLFIIAAYLLWELYRWLRSTRISALERFRPYVNTLAVLASFLFFALIGLLLLKVEIALLALPLCALALFLLIAEPHSDAKRLTYFIIGTAFLLTIMVELIWPEGDNGRQNSVFKLYLQAWMLLSLVAGPAIMLAWKAHKDWKLPYQLLYEVPLILLLAGAAFFPLMATMDKTTDRMDRNAPHTLDGMNFMQTSTYMENGVLDPKRQQQMQPMRLDEDYLAIQWMQDHVSGSPVIVEGQAYEYRWGNRYTIYTGLPGVVGWNYHQRQQHAILADNRVQYRVDRVNEFYNTQDMGFVKDFLAKYRVAFIVVGQLEARFYPDGGLDKFPVNEGILWDKVFSTGQTTVYQVRP